MDDNLRAWAVVPHRPLWDAKRTPQAQPPPTLQAGQGRRRESRRYSWARLWRGGRCPARDTPRRATPWARSHWASTRTRRAKASALSTSRLASGRQARRQTSLWYAQCL